MSFSSNLLTNLDVALWLWQAPQMSAGRVSSFKHVLTLVPFCTRGHILITSIEEVKEEKYVGPLIKICDEIL